MKPNGCAVRVFRVTPNFVPLGQRRRDRGGHGKPEEKREPVARFRFPAVAPSSPRPVLLTPPGDMKPLVAGTSQEVRVDRRTWLASQVLGVIAMLCVLNLWASVTAGKLLEVFVGDGTWSESWTNGAVPLALYGAHFFGLPAAYLLRDRWSLGILAVALVWLTFLLGVPVLYFFR